MAEISEAIAEKQSALEANRRTLPHYFRRSLVASVGARPQRVGRISEQGRAAGESPQLPVRNFQMERMRELLEER
jgi:hypothetical protein